MALYFHSMIADYYLGIWGGGVPKPFKFTEIQRHRFNLADKEGAADRKVPIQPLMFHSKDGKITRYNLRKVCLCAPSKFLVNTNLGFSLGSCRFIWYARNALKTYTKTCFLITSGCTQSYPVVRYRRFLPIMKTLAPILTTKIQKGFSRTKQT